MGDATDLETMEDGAQVYADLVRTPGLRRRAGVWLSGLARGQRDRPAPGVALWVLGVVATWGTLLAAGLAMAVA